MSDTSNEVWKYEIFKEEYTQVMAQGKIGSIPRKIVSPSLIYYKEFIYLFAGIDERTGEKSNWVYKLDINNPRAWSQATNLTKFTDNVLVFPYN